MVEIIIAITSSVVFSSAASGIIIWLSKTWIGERLRESIKHEYSTKMEEYKTGLGLESQKQIINFKNEIERGLVIQGVGNKSLEDVNRIKMQKLLQAVDALWGAVLAFRTIMPPIAGIVDAISPTDVRLYQSLKASRDYDTIRGEANSEAFKSAMQNKINNIENYRIYLGEYLWSLYHALMVINIRFYFTLHFEQDDNKVVRWHEDEIIRAFVKSVLSDEEMRTYEGRNFGKLAMIRDFIEKKIMATIRKLISAETIAEESLKQAKAIDENIQKLKEKYAMQIGL
jgi:hypothetical protein